MLKSSLGPNRVSGKATLRIIRYPEVLNFVGTIQQHADTHRDALGFLPASAYAEAARRKRILVAVSSSTGEYLGHVFTGGIFPNMSIVQTFVAESARGQNVGRQLIAAVSAEAEENHWLSIRAAVASDLDEATKFYTSVGFVKVHSRRGGETRQRIINVLVKDLDTPTLFDYASDELAEGLSRRAHISPVPVCLIDVNVLLDVAHKRERAKSASSLISAALEGHVRLVVADEFVEELQRASVGILDPLLEFAKSLPRLGSSSGDANSVPLQEVSRVMFPECEYSSLRVNTQSDVKHVHCAVVNNAYALVTSDAKLLSKVGAVSKRYGIQILALSEIAGKIANLCSDDSYGLEKFAEKELRIEDLGPRSVSRAVDAFAGNFVEPLIESVTNVLAGVEVLRGDRVCCIALWRKSDELSEFTRVRIYAQEDDPAIETALEFLLSRVTGKCSSNSHEALIIEVTNVLGVDAFASVALRQGFKPSVSAKGTIFQRIALKAIVTPATWEDARRGLEEKMDLSFPESLPTYSDQGVWFKVSSRRSKRTLIPLDELESYLNPAIFLMEGRKGAIVSLRGNYARQLFGSGAQNSLFPRHVAATLNERVYFSSKRNLDLLQAGKLILFYESSKNGGQSAIVAVARIIASSIVDAARGADSLLRQGVINDFRELSACSEMTATRFDSVTCLKQPVPFQTLRKLGIADGANLVSAKGVEGVALHQILLEGGLIGRL